MRAARIGDVLRRYDPLDIDRLVDPAHALPDDRVVIAASVDGWNAAVSVVALREWLDWRIGGDL